MTDSWEQRYRAGAHGAHGHAHAHAHGANAVATAGAGAELAGIVAMLGDERGTVVDVGCGAGADAIYLAQCGFDAVGIDSSPAALELAAQRSTEANVQVRWVQADALDLPLADGSIAAAFDRGCLHHLRLEEQPRYLAELARVLVPGGRVFLRDTLHPGEHVSPVTRDGLTRLVEGLPLRVTAIVPFEMQGGHGASSAMLAVLERAGAVTGGRFAGGLFAGLPVSDYARSVQWYERLLGAAPSFLPNEAEAVWQLAEDRFVYVVERPQGAPHSEQLVWVDDLDAAVDEIAARGIEPTRTETYDNGVRKVVFEDPDGNEFSLGGSPSPTA